MVRRPPLSTRLVTPVPIMPRFRSAILLWKTVMRKGDEPRALAFAPPPAKAGEGTKQTARFPGPFRITNHQSRPSGRKQRLHLLQRVRLDLADAFGGDAVLVGQFLQGDLVVVVQPAALDDVARSVVQAAHAFAQQPKLVVLAVHALVGLRRDLVAGPQVRGGRRRGVVVVVAGGRENGRASWRERVCEYV